MYGIRSKRGFMMKGRLSGKVAIVTGGGAHKDGETGTGFATVVSFAREGAQVLIVDISEENAKRTLSALKAEGKDGSVLVADVTSDNECKEMMDVVKRRYGNLHILMNNAGIAASSNVTDLKEEILEKSLDINLKSAVFASKYAIPLMSKSGGGSIINISSIDGIVAGMHHNVSYAVAKGGLHMLTKTTAAYHGREGIRANCIAPGHLFAVFTSKLPNKTRDLRRRAGPLGSEGTAWDVAKAAVFLASDESRWISGVTLPVDGGLLAAAPLTAYSYLEKIPF